MKPTIPTTPSRWPGRSAIAASPRNPARASTSRLINATRAAKWSADGEKCFIAGEDLTCQAGPRRAAGSRARRTDRRHPCRAQRPSLCRRLWRHAGRRSAGVSVSASRSLHPRRRQGPARDPRRRSPDGIADGTRLRHISSSGLVDDVAAGAASTTKVCRRKQYDDQTSRPDHERRHRPHGAEPAPDPFDRRDPRPGRRAARRTATACMPDPILVGRDAEKVERLAKRFNIARWSPPISTRRWPTRTTPCSSMPRPRRRGPRC